MVEKKPPQKPTNLRPYDCDLIVIYCQQLNKLEITKLEISPYYEKHNQEYLAALEKKGIVLSEEELATKLITDDLIRKTLIPQLNEIEVKPEGKYYHWTYYSQRTFKEFKEKTKAYKLVWCVADNEPHILGIIDCYRQSKFDILSEIETK